MSDDEASTTAPPPPPLSTGITGDLSNLAPPLSLLVPAEDVVSRRAHRRVAPPGEALPLSTSYNLAVNTISKGAHNDVYEAAMKGELTVPATITEREVEVLDLDASLLEEQVTELKRKLHIKMRDHDAVRARLRLAKKMMAERQKKERAEQRAALRAERAALMRQKSEEEAAARPAPEKDLTREGIEPNP
jgi:hypothetical protein